MQNASPRARRRAHTAFVLGQVFSPASAALLRGLLAFADPPALASHEATSGLFGSGTPSLVELACATRSGRRGCRWASPTRGGGAVGAAAVLRADAHGLGAAAHAVGQGGASHNRCVRSLSLDLSA